MREIDLNEILNRYAEDVCIYKIDKEEKQSILYAMKEACEQAIDMCSNNIELIDNYRVNHGIIQSDSKFDDTRDYYINKASILNVKNLIKCNELKNS